MLQDIVDFTWSNVPKTPLELLVDLAFAVPVVFAMLTIMEHRIHLNLMHIKAMPKIVYNKIPFLNRFQYRHAVMHHSIFYRQFDLELDPEGRHANIKIRLYQSAIMGIVGLPPILLMATFVAVVFGVLGFVHNQTWNAVHTQMHMPKPVWFRNTAYFRFVARHHFLHHMQPNKNLNVVLPCADWFFATVAKPQLSDVREMLRLGYVSPRSPQGKQLQPALKPQPGYTFVHTERTPTAQTSEDVSPPSMPPVGAELGAA